MTKLIPPQGQAIQVDVNGRRYNQRRGGFNVDIPADEKAMRRSGWESEKHRIAGREGFRCQACGFLAVFSKSPCGRCGGTDLLPEDEA